MWPWERKAYERGYEQGRLDQHDADIRTMLPEGDKADRELAAAKAETEAEYRRLGSLLWEARRELPDDHPLHARIREALDKGGEPDSPLARIEAMFPGTVTRR